ncbi:MAG TPA: pirin family protein [Candidatus Melainabacteria bacterium]|nr:pirin family protein [Candidatus Melainabacteria bacterium]HIN66270.1 pirin family protein [Candidatus Obscuribacterales bacterium]
MKNTENLNLERTKSRSVKGIITSIATREGAGFAVRRPFPTHSLSYVDPFLLLDHMEPVTLAPGAARGAPDHPHRGFETVTYMLEGHFVHRDSAGNSGTIGPGDVQWMTAGQGVVHSEMPDDELLENGGRLHGFQIWVNLPAREKLIAPRYQDIPSSQIPIAESEDGKVWVKVIAGQSMGKEAVIDTRTPITFLHAKLKPGAKLVQPVSSQYNTFAYVVEGKGYFGNEQLPAETDQLVLFSNNGDTVLIETQENQELSVLILGGLPLNEPVARYGPFVMNTQSEIVQALQDYQAGRMGAIS